LVITLAKFLVTTNHHETKPSPALPYPRQILLLSRPACEEDQVVIWNKFIDESYISKNISLAFLTHINVNYIQHNPYALSERQTAIGTPTPFGLFSTSRLFTIGSPKYRILGVSFEHFREIFGSCCGFCSSYYETLPH
jgi:hypothetical protein